MLDQVKVKSSCHITGGGFYENIPRALNDNVKAVIKKEDVKVLPIFKLIQQEGNIPERDMFNTFNMGVGMMLIVAANDVDKTLEILHAQGEDAYVVGRIEAGSKEVELL